VLVWDVQTRELLRTARLCEHMLGHLAFTPDGLDLLVSGQDGLWRWPLAGGAGVRVELQVEKGWDPLYALALSPDGQRLAARRYDVACYAAAGGAWLWRARLEGEHWSKPVVFTPDGSEVVTGAGDQLHFFRADTGMGSRPPLELPHMVNCAAISPDGAVVAVGAKTRLPVWRLEPRTLLTTHLATGRKHFQACAFHPSGRLLAATGKDGLVVLLDTATWRESARLDWGVGPLLDVAFSPDGNLGACCTEKGQVVVWDVDA
jgi:WD40 repeat protein